MPDFRLTSMFDHLPFLAIFIEVDGHSSGNEQIPCLIQTAPYAPDLQGNWMSVTASVTNETEGFPGSHWDLRRNSAPPGLGWRPGSDLVSYYYDTPGVAAALRGATIVEQLAENMGFDVASDDPDISSLDFGMGVVTFMEQPALGGLVFSNADQYFFSLSERSCTEINNIYASQSEEFALSKTGPSGTYAQAHPATIYEIQWTGGDWTHPKEVWTYDELGLDFDDNIDALAVNKDDGAKIVVFSTQQVEGRSQLLAFDKALYWATSTNPNPVRSVPLVIDMQGAWVSEELGVQSSPSEGPGDLDGVCFIEPEPAYYSDFFGRNDYYPVPTGEPIGLGMARWAERDDTAGQDHNITLIASGWGNAPTDSPGAVYFFWRRFDPPATLTPYRLFGSKLRSTGQDNVEIVVSAKTFENTIANTGRIEVVAVFNYGLNKWATSLNCAFGN